MPAAELPAELNVNETLVRVAVPVPPFSIPPPPPPEAGFRVKIRLARVRAEVPGPTYSPPPRAYPGGKLPLESFALPAVMVKPSRTVADVKSFAVTTWKLLSPQSPGVPTSPLR